MVTQARILSKKIVSAKIRLFFLPINYLTGRVDFGGPQKILFINSFCYYVAYRTPDSRKEKAIKTLYLLFAISLKLPVLSAKVMED